MSSLTQLLAFSNIELPHPGWRCPVSLFSTSLPMQTPQPAMVVNEIQSRVIDEMIKIRFVFLTIDWEIMNDFESFKAFVPPFAKVLLAIVRAFNQVCLQSVVFWFFFGCVYCFNEAANTGSGPLEKALEAVKTHNIFENKGSRDQHQAFWRARDVSMPSSDAHVQTCQSSVMGVCFAPMLCVLFLSVHYLSFAHFVLLVLEEIEEVHAFLQAWLNVFYQLQDCYKDHLGSQGLTFKQ